jgi:hypothetical protein
VRLNLNLPLNPVSFGQVSFNLLKEAYSRNLDVSLFPVGNVDLGSYNIDAKFIEWIKSSIENSQLNFKRSDKTFKLWHLNGGCESFGEKQTLFSFYELDQPTETEVNIVKNLDKVIFSSNQAVEAFKKAGCNNVHYVPLGFDSNSFNLTNKKYFNDGRIIFNLCGKLEKRKHHGKIIQSWIKKFGDNKKYFLQCAIYNNFLDEKTNLGLVSSFVGGKKYFNISFLGSMPKNELYNDFLNSGNIVIGMSGGEGWGLPEFHSVALGKYGVILNAHSYKDWANSKNSILVEPSENKIDSEDGVFFKKGAYFNQGNLFDFNEDQFIDACEKAIKMAEENEVNKEGLKLQKDFTYAKTLDKILEIL